MTAGEAVEKRRRNRRRALWALNGLALVLALSFDWARHRPALLRAAPRPFSSALLPQPPPGSVLLERAPKIARVAPRLLKRLGSYGPYSGNLGGYGPYFWRSDHEMVRFTGDGYGNYQALRLDTRTGKEAPFRLDGKPLVLYDAWDLTVSPNGKWLLWGEGDTERIVARALDGSGRRSWRRPPGLGRVMWLGDAWLPGSDAWVRLAAVRDQVVAIVYRLRPGKDTAEVRPLQGLHDLSWYQSIGTTPNLLGFSRTGQSAILWGDYVSAERVLKVGTFTVADSVRMSHSVTVPPPPELDYGEVQVSPRGDRLLWHSFTEPPQPERPRFAFWVSDLNGNGTREIGHTFLPPADNWGVSHTSPPEWTPDDKRISFIQDGVLRVLPVD